MNKALDEATFPPPLISEPRPALAMDAAPAAVAVTTMPILAALSLSHMLNDTIQSLIPAMYPVLKEAHQFTFGQIGLITFTFQLTASLLQPLVGVVLDLRPKPFMLPIGMTVTLMGLLLLSRADTLPWILIAAALVGTGSSIFHPEASRLAHMAAGKRHGFAQSLFQLGGNFGTSLGPLLAAWIIVPRGQHAAAWFAIVAIVAIIVLTRIGAWYSSQLFQLRGKPKPRRAPGHANVSPTRIGIAMAVLVLLVMSKNFYLVSFTNYYTFFLIHKFGLPVETSQVYLFVFLVSVAAGTILGGPMSDRFGRKAVIWVSILGVAPFSLLLPHVGLTATVALSVGAGLVMASAFSTIVVFAQELVPGRVGLIAGLFFGVAFGGAGIAAAGLGALADRTSIEFVFQICGFLPLIGVLTILLPRVSNRPH
jgi:FSR family fosmidomycin resistance protein-like MFS transporter